MISMTSEECVFFARTDLCGEHERIEHRTRPISPRNDEQDNEVHQNNGRKIVGDDADVVEVKAVGKSGQ